MTSVTVDNALLALLRKVEGVAELRDANGNVVGFFAPVTLAQAQRYAEAAARVDPEAIERRKADNQLGRTTAEVIKRLQSPIGWSCDGVQ